MKIGRWNVERLVKTNDDYCRNVLFSVNEFQRLKTFSVNFLIDERQIEQNIVQIKVLNDDALVIWN